jgi:hypothetical protein
LSALADGPDTASAEAAAGKYEFKALPAGYYYTFALPLPNGDWDSLVPEAPRGGVAWTAGPS